MQQSAKHSHSRLHMVVVLYKQRCDSWVECQLIRAGLECNLNIVNCEFLLKEKYGDKRILTPSRDKSTPVARYRETDLCNCEMVILA